LQVVVYFLQSGYFWQQVFLEPGGAVDLDEVAEAVDGLAADREDFVFEQVEIHFTVFFVYQKVWAESLSQVDEDVEGLAPDAPAFVGC
jgi:hypothetical protein